MIIDGGANVAEGIGRCVTAFTGEKYDLNFVRNFAEELSPEYGKVAYDGAQLVLNIKGMLNGVEVNLGHGIVDPSTGKLITNISENLDYEGKIFVQPFIVKNVDKGFFEQLGGVANGIGVLDGAVSASDSVDDEQDDENK